ncbi:MAG: NifB/NifX family molybdenum-iron cluster-binding protein [Elusimicrobiota bacterium]
MRVFFPVEHDKGLSSRLCEHFGAAEMFLVINWEQSKVTQVLNSDRRQAQGLCGPASTLIECGAGCLITKEIGRKGLQRLGTAGIPVYAAETDTVKENLRLLHAGKLERLHDASVCDEHPHCAAPAS